MKKRKIRLMLVTLAATISMLSGCGKAGEEAMQETNSLNENGNNENAPQNEDAEEEKDSNTETKNADLNDTKAENGEEELVTVSVTEDTKFQVRTIKNGGEDVTEREGTFEDMKKDMIVNVTGYMDNAGEEIRASEIVIMEVISQ